MLFLNLLLFLVFCIHLSASGHIIVKTLIKISRHYGIREFVVGFVLVALSTSLPELFVGITSALDKIPAITLGNVIGSNIVALTLVIGVAALIGKNIKIEGEIEKRDILYTCIIAFLPLILFLDHTLSEVDGMVLLLIFLLYLIRLFAQSKEFKRLVKERIEKREVMENLFAFFIALVILLLSAEYIVRYGTFLVSDLNLHPIIIGLILVSIGTSLPELSFEAQSVLKGHPGMAVGNLLGSVVLNSTLVLGVTSIIYPIKAHFLSFIVGSLFLILNLILFFTFSKTGKKISWREGLFLVVLYVFFIIFSFISKI